VKRSDPTEKQVVNGEFEGGAGERNRTFTGSDPRQILSLLRLPVPPHRRKLRIAQTQEFHSCQLLLVEAKECHRVAGLATVGETQSLERAVKHAVQGHEALAQGEDRDGEGVQLHDRGSETGRRGWIRRGGEVYVAQLAGLAALDGDFEGAVALIDEKKLARAIG
jgi:hypothetical protein